MTDKDDPELPKMSNEDLIKIAFPSERDDFVETNKSNLRSKMKSFTTLTWLIALILFLGFLVWSGGNETNDLTPTEELELLVFGDWVTINGNTRIFLNHDNTATLYTYGADGVYKESTGKWRSTGPDTIDIEIEGESGNYAFNLALIQGDAIFILAPVPTDTALLKECFFEDKEANEAMMDEIMNESIW
jgi:hypothetical protein